MSGQVADTKFILDATAGFRMMWKNKKHPNVLYIDSRKECNPDEIQDFRHMPYSDGSFQLVVFDPPHSIRNANFGHIQRDYGALCPETWQSDLKKGFAECWRVLRNNGILIFKWGETDRPLRTIIPLFPAEPLFWQKSAGSTSRGSRPCGTYWVCYMKIPEEVGV